MKTIQNNAKRVMLFICLSMAVLSFSMCGSEGDDNNDGETGPCEHLECQNGGEAIVDVEFDGCRCNCPTGFTGEFCETTYCPGNIECPNGQSPNPANDCQCE